MTARTTLRDAITPPAMRARVRELADADPDVGAIRDAIGEARLLDWAHAVGAGSDPVLASCVPAVPPRALRARVGEPEAEMFLWTGLIDLKVILAAWERHGPEIVGREPFVLDFGCGCGRLLRFLSSAPAAVFGAEPEVELRAWCRENLPTALMLATAEEPPLPCEPARFDLVYALSVLPRMSPDRQAAWLAEIARVLREGGILVATVDDATSLPPTPGLGVVEIAPRGLRGWQDVVVGRRA